MNHDEVKLADCDMRPAMVDDVPAMIAMLETGRELLAADGIDQWQNGTGPDVQSVTKDLMQGWGRVFCVRGQVAATAALIPGPDPNYDAIEDGSWDRTGNPGGAYATIHRVAVSPPTAATTSGDASTSGSSRRRAPAASRRSAWTPTRTTPACAT